MGKEKRVSNTVQEEVRKEVKRLKVLKDMLASFCTQITQKKNPHPQKINPSALQWPTHHVLQESKAAAAVATQARSLMKDGAWIAYWDWPNCFLKSINI